MAEGMDFFEVIQTQRAIRYFKPDPIPDDVIRKILEAGVKAPTGGVRQGWGFIVIRDQESRKKIGDLYRSATGFQITPEMTDQQRHAYTSAAYLEDHMDEVPAFLLVCIGTDGSPGNMVRGSSIYPAVQNMLLAARALGVGSVLTTRQRRFEGEIKDLLGIPEDVETAALLPLGYPAEGSRYGPTRRRPLEEVAFYERWGNGIHG